MTDDPSIFRGLCERSWWQNLSPSLCLMTGRPFFYNGPAISRDPALLPTVGLVALIRTSFLPAPSPAPDQRPPFKRRQGNASRSPAPASRRTRGKWNDDPLASCRWTLFSRRNPEQPSGPALATAMPSSPPPPPPFPMTSESFLLRDDVPWRGSELGLGVVMNFGLRWYRRDVHKRLGLAFISKARDESSKTMYNFNNIS